ncbi:hypothetical protein A3Q56_05239, partial [Intoshia linei]
MGNSFTKLLSKAIKCKLNLRIVMVGLDSSGKTCLLQYLSGSTQDNINTPTIGFNVNTVSINKKLNIILWDLGGQASLRSTWNMFINDISGIIYVIDSCDHNRFELAKNELIMLLEEPKIQTVPVIILANKQDLKYAITVERLKNYLNLYEENCFKNRSWDACAISALTG